MELATLPTLDVPASEQERGLDLLLVEDNPGDALLTKAMLNKCAGTEFHLANAQSVKEARRELENKHFDCMLLDLCLPDADSLQSLYALRAFDNGLSKSPPIVILSGQQSRDLAVRAIKDGAEDFLVKGQVDAERLWGSVLSAIDPVEGAQRELLGGMRDPFTGLPGSALFLDCLSQTIASASRRYHQFAVLFIRLNNLRSVKQQNGQGVHDELLFEMSHRIQDMLPENDTVARVGSTDFAVLCDHVSAETIDRRVKQIKGALRREHLIDGTPVYSWASVGVSLGPSANNYDADSLLTSAHQDCCADILLSELF